MIFFSEIEIEKLVVHSVGNKLKGDSILCSDSTVVLGSELEDVLLKYFINPFKPNEFYNLANIEHNEVYLSVKQIFSNSNNFIAESQKIARRLFEETRNPKVAGGNLFIVYFNKCIINDELTNAVGIFKSEISETFLKIKPSNERFSIEREAGINISKMTKGCMIYAYEESDGYLVSIIDKRSKKEEVSYWSDNFLNLVPREDEYFQTKYTLSCIENYISNAMPEQFEISRADQADLLNKTLEYFKENDDFNREVYSEEVFQNIEITNSFSEFCDIYQQDNNVEITNQFTINKSALKKQARRLKTVIKLDDKFDITIHKNKENLLRGEDEATGLQYYQLLFKEEK